MSRSLLKTLLALAALVALLGLGACGGDDDEAGDERRHARADRGGRRRTSPSSSSPAAPPTTARTRRRRQEGRQADRPLGRRRRLHGSRQDVLQRTRSGSSDAIHRELYAYLPDDTTKPVPDLAEGDPEISEDGKTVTVKIKQGVMFSKPVNREVTSKDVKYAIERALHRRRRRTATHASTCGDLVGAPKEPGDYKEIPGIETPDDQTIVFKLTKGTGAALAGALAMPISVPVPKEYAQKYDKETPVDLRRGARGLHRPVHGRVRRRGQGRSATCPASASTSCATRTTRRSTTSGPAFLDEIDIQAGNEDTAVATRRDPRRARAWRSGEHRAAGEPAQAAAREQQDRALGGARRRLAHDLDGHEPPAVRRHRRAQGRDRRLQPRRGAPAARRRGARADRPAPDPAGHGGLRGVQRLSRAGSTRWTGWPIREGDRAKSAEYFKKAGFASGKYEGDEELLIVGDNAEPDKSISQITEQQLNEMGFKTKLRLVTRDTMFTKFCNVPEVRGPRLPVGGLAAGLRRSADDARPDVQRGATSCEAGNSNWPELDVPELNDADQRGQARDRPGRARAGVGRRQQDDHGAGAGDPVHVGLPGRSSPRRTCAACRAATAPTWDWNFTSLR